MFRHVIRWKKNPLFESSSPDQLLAAEMLQFSESSPEFFGTRGPRTVGLFPTRHSLRNLAMINDRLAAHSFKQQSFPREKILYIRNERSEGVFLYLPFKITPCPPARFAWQFSLFLQATQFLYFKCLL